MGSTCLVLDLSGLVPYPVGVSLQECLAAQRAANVLPDILVLLEHTPVFTIGRRGQMSDIHAPPDVLASLGISVCQSSRGGLVTYHGPGQIVGYPIAHLRSLAGRVPAYIYGLEEVMIRALKKVGVEATRREHHPGVWAEGGKIGAIGVGLKRDITMHGFSVNLHPDLSHFGLINPCGLGSEGVTSVQRVLGRKVDMVLFRRLVASAFGEVFGCTMEYVHPGQLPGLAELLGVLRQCGSSSMA